MGRPSPFKIAQDKDGYFKRMIGKKLSKTGNLFDPADFVPVTFYLGRDRAQAAINSVRLEKVWDAVQAKWFKLRDTACAHWDETTLAIGKAVASGATRIEVEFPHVDDAHLVPGASVSELAARWLADLRQQFPDLELDHADPRLRENAAAHVEDKIRRADAAAEDARKLRGVASGHKLREALAAYCEYVRLKQRDREDAEVLSDYGALILRRVEHVERILGADLDKPLASVNNDFLDRWILTWANRPETAKGGTSSVSWCVGVIKTLREFIRWLHKTDLFAWEKPRGYEVSPVTIRQTGDEVEAEQTVTRYKLDEVGILWQYANARDRVFLLLGLNCGFGLGEIATLRRSELHLDKPKPFIKRLRRKNKRWGRWWLWPETVAGLRWYLEKVRPASESRYVFVTDEGRPLAARTKGGRNRVQVVPNLWTRLHVRVEKDHPKFERRTFNKLRKSGATWVRNKAGVEVCSLYLSHGKKVMADHYAAKAFRPVSKALRAIHKTLAPVLATVADPFPEEQKRAPNIIMPRSKVRRIQELRRQGYTIKKIAEITGVCTQTVNRYVPRVGKGQRVQPQEGGAASE